MYDFFENHGIAMDLRSFIPIGQAAAAVQVSPNLSVRRK